MQVNRVATGTPRCSVTQLTLALEVAQDVSVAPDAPVLPQASVEKDTHAVPKCPDAPLAL
jgi:hypothetical protein